MTKGHHSNKNNGETPKRDHHPGMDTPKSLKMPQLTEFKLASGSPIHAPQEMPKYSMRHSLPPQPLTSGMPDPNTIEKQKMAYIKMLDEQFKQGTQVLEAQASQQKEDLKSKAEQQKKEFIMQIDMEVKQKEMNLEQQRQEHLMALQTQAAQQKASLEQQALQLSRQYQQKKAEEDWERNQYEMERKQEDLQCKMREEMQKFMAAPVPNAGLHTPAAFHIPGIVIPEEAK